jgi:MSHA biogenesis protein MshQ
VWLDVLIILRRGGKLCPLLCAATALLLAGAAQAASYNFNGGNVVPTCPLTGTTYNCTSLPNSNDTDLIIIASGYTVVTASSFSPSYNQGLSMSGSAVLRSSGSASIDLSASNNINVSGGTLTAGGNFKLGASTQSITANVNAATITTGGSSTSITGTVSASGAINFGSNTTINGSVSANSISTGSSTTITGALNVSGQADLGSAIKINGNLTAGSVKTNSPGNIGGSITANTTIDLGSGMTVGGSISGTTITTTSPVTLNGTVSASVAFTLASGSTVTGNITAPTVTLSASGSTVKGNITTTGALDIGSGNTVTGAVNAGSLTMRASGAVINGTTKVSGDVDLGSGTTINGDLTARNVTTRASNAVINGNAAVNSIYIDWGNSVTQTITCTGPGAALCSCVTKADSNYQPRCGTPPAVGAHHIQITHSGVGLTCQPQTVQLKACADANCSTTYTGSTTVALSPGGGNVTFAGTGTGTVSQSVAGNATLSASSTGISNANVCPNAATGTNNCQMTYKDEGLVLTVPDHVSMKPGVKLNIQALKTSPQGSCVPLVQGTVPIKFSCAYKNPLPASANQVPVNVSAANITCDGSTTSINLTFDNNGLSTPALQYSEVGQTSIAASYTSGNLGASGAVQFTTAPAKLKVEPIRLSSVGLPLANFSPTGFAKGSEPFKVKLTALNAADNPTKNFGRESPNPQGFSIPTPVLTDPTGGNNPVVQGKYKGTVDGVADALDGSTGLWRFDETGTLSVVVKLATSSTYYLDNPTTDFNPQTKVDLLFVPDHFDITHADTLPMSCTLVGGLNNPCSPNNTNGKFLYSLQPFSLVLNAYIGAKDAQGNYIAPQNYVGAAARPITLQPINASGVVPATVGEVHWSKEPNNVPGPRFAFAYDAAAKKTIGTLTASGNLPSFDFTATTPPAPTAPTTLSLRAVDSDLASSQGGAEPLLTFVSGWMAISNVSGPLTAPVPVTTRAQYWNSSAYVFNSQFQLGSTPMYTTINGVKTYFITYSNCQNGLDTSSNKAHTCPGGSTLKIAAPETIAFKDGVGRFSLAQPTPALSRNGSVDIKLKSGSTELIKYLPSGTGTIVFGVYRSGPVIYTREVYN